MVDLPPPDGPTRATVCNQKMQQRGEASADTGSGLKEQRAGKQQQQNLRAPHACLPPQAPTWPGRNVMLRPRTAQSVAPGYLNHTSLNSTRPLLLAVGGAAAVGLLAVLLPLPPSLPLLPLQLLLLLRVASLLLLLRAAAAAAWLGATSSATRSKAPTALPSSPREAAAEDRPTEMNRFSTFTAAMASRSP